MSNVLQDLLQDLCLFDDDVREVVFGTAADAPFHRNSHELLASCFLCIMLACLLPIYAMQLMPLLLDHYCLYISCDSSVSENISFQSLLMMDRLLAQVVKPVLGDTLC